MNNQQRNATLSMVYEIKSDGHSGVGLHFRFDRAKLALTDDPRSKAFHHFGSDTGKKATQFLKIENFLRIFWQKHCLL